MNSLTDSDVCPTAAVVARHRFIYVGVVWRLIIGQQGSCTHDLARLTVTALGNIMLYPGTL
jgi:hypothetical protein